MANGKSEEDLFHELSFYTLAHHDPAYFIHQHIVDAYGAQTADENSKPVGLVMTLVGLYLYIEKGYTGRAVQRVHMLLGKYPKEWPIFEQPADRGAIRVADVLAVPPGEARDEAIREWCASVWEAYRDSYQAVADYLRAELPDLPDTA